MLNEHVDQLLQELYGKDLVGKDIWNPLYDPNKSENKPSIELDEPYQPKTTEWFDSKSLQLNMAPAKKLAAVSEIIKEVRGKDLEKVSSLLQKINHAIDSNNINDETMNIIGTQLETLKSMWDNFKGMAKQETDKLTFNSIMKEIINVVFKKLTR